MKCAITGALSYSRYLAASLLSKGHDVVNLSRRGVPSRPATERPQALRSGRIACGWISTTSTPWRGASRGASWLDALGVARRSYKPPPSKTAPARGCETSGRPIVMARTQIRLHIAGKHGRGGAARARRELRDRAAVRYGDSAQSPSRYRAAWVCRSPSSSGRDEHRLPCTE